MSAQRSWINLREALKATETLGALAAKERKPLDAEIMHLLGNAARGTCSATVG